MTNLVQQKLELHLREEKKESQGSKFKAKATNNKEDSGNQDKAISQDRDLNDKDCSSTASVDTVKRKSKNHHYNDTDEDALWSNITAEDDKNTVDSNETSKRDKHSSER